MLKYWRMVLLAVVTILGGKSLYDWGLPGFPWFISDWGVFVGIGTQLLLLMSHFRTYD